MAGGERLPILLNSQKKEETNARRWTDLSIPLDPDRHVQFDASTLLAPRDLLTAQSSFRTDKNFLRSRSTVAQRYNAKTSTLDDRHKQDGSCTTPATSSLHQSQFFNSDVEHQSKLETDAKPEPRQFIKLRAPRRKRLSESESVKGTDESTKPVSDRGKLNLPTDGEENDHVTKSVDELEDTTALSSICLDPPNQPDLESNEMVSIDERASKSQVDGGSRTRRSGSRTPDYQHGESAVFVPRFQQAAPKSTSRQQTLAAKSRPYDVLVKLMLLGDSSVGKSSLLLRFCCGKFEPAHVLTIGVDFKSRLVDGDDNEKIKLQVWDTAGQERFHNLAPVYFRTAMGIVLVFDVGKWETFKNIGRWVADLDELADARTLRVLVGNKVDLEARQVTREEGEALANQYKIQYYETSAKLDNNVEELFSEVAREIRRRQRNIDYPSSAEHPARIILDDCNNDGSKASRTLSYSERCCTF